MGAPGRQGGMSSEMRFFLDSLGPLQQQVLSGNSYGALKVTPACSRTYEGWALDLVINSSKPPPHPRRQAGSIRGLRRLQVGTLCAVTKKLTHGFETHFSKPIQAEGASTPSQPFGSPNSSHLRMHSCEIYARCLEMCKPYESCLRHPQLLVQGKVGSAFTSVGGNGRGYGGHEAILQSFHSTFLQHGMVPFPSLLTSPTKRKLVQGSIWSFLSA